MNQNQQYDVVIIGGGPAGLAAAVALARSLRSVVVIDAGEPRNAPAHGVHNFLTREGMPPAEVLAHGRREAEGYGVTFLDGRAVEAAREGNEFGVRIEDGTEVRGRRLLLTSGLIDELPDVPGLQRFWGSSVLHCPYCHGWEARGQRIGVVGRGAASLHQVLLFRQLSDDVTLFVHEMEPLSDEQTEQLAALGVQIIEGRVERLSDDGEQLRGVVLADGTEVEVDAVTVAPRFVARGALYEQLGGKLEPHPAGFGELIPIDPSGRTQVDGVWAAGNASDLGSMVVAAAGSGLTTAAQINADLAHEDTDLAVQRHRQPS
ncbi:NAD(P)/FAD-dependent oxidoreductase [Aeromicrobium phragmitis]|uniref:NAD(P)/FAD-dependent oxidoreductase n=1 Tax=Aeromicrobium phragmitis TaxID=2478914 RepID=A0A3L8PKF2_9ACTN|nr:NAD(P)/FAD-dependent oxidoreductase [Aeromicrobium phragmitis]RLV54532.1 NAD(P)/FAD-dependent oxidoreductase [Aeromicrobium phragmitis]